MAKKHIFNYIPGVNELIFSSVLFNYIIPTLDMMDSPALCSRQTYQCGNKCIAKLLPCDGSCAMGYISCGALCLEKEFHWKCGDTCLYHEEPCENSCPENYILCGTKCVDIQNVERDIEWFENSCKYGAENTQWVVSSVLLILLISIIKKYL